MCKLKGIELPEGIVDVYRETVMNADDDNILHYAKHVDEGLLQGLRPIKKNVTAIKERLAGHIGRNISGKQFLQLDVTFGGMACGPTWDTARARRWTSCSAS